MDKDVKNLFVIKFLGCKVNNYEVESIANSLEELGFFMYNEKDSKDDVKVVILNTCAVTKTSEKKSRNMINRLRKSFPNACLTVMGCYSSVDFDFIKENLNVDILIGTENRDRLISLIKENLTTKKRFFLKDNGNQKKYEELKVNKFLLNTRSYVKIQDGCNNFCSYCLIPFLRGRSRSRKKEDILEEISTLIKNGYKEIVLVGIDMSSYGLDLYDDYNFSDLVEDILINNPDLFRLRISSIEESNIDEKFIGLLAKYKNLASHLHIPLQAGSPKIIESMRRKYDLESFVSKVHKIKEIRDNIFLSTDVIVGFPGETDEDFNLTIDSIKRIGFDKIHVFPYSRRKFTLADKFPNQVDEIVKNKRTQALIEISTTLEEEFCKRFKGNEFDFLIEEKKNGYYVGHSSNFLEIKIKSNEDLVGKIIKTKY